MQIEYSRRFVKELRKAPRKIQIAFRDRLVIFIENGDIVFFIMLGTHSQLYK